MGQRDLGLERAWRRLVRGQPASGLSVRAFCAREGLAESAFYFWRRELDRRQAERSPPQFAEDPEERPAAADRLGSSSLLTAIETGAGPRFLPVRIAEPAEPARTDSTPASSSLLELVHPGGIVIRVPNGSDVTALRSILDLLDERAWETRSC